MVAWSDNVRWMFIVIITSVHCDNFYGCGYDPAYHIVINLDSLCHCLRDWLNFEGLALYLCSYRPEHLICGSQGSSTL